MSEPLYDEPFVDQDGQDYYADTSETDAALGEGWQERWAQEDAQRAAEAQQAEAQQLVEGYSNLRLGSLTSQAMESAGQPTIALPDLHSTASALLQSSDFRRAHPGLEGEPLVAAGLAAAISALTVEDAPDELTAMKRREIRQMANGKGG